MPKNKAENRKQKIHGLSCSTYPTRNRGAILAIPAANPRQIVQQPTKNEHVTFEGRDFLTDHDELGIVFVHVSLEIFCRSIFGIFEANNL